jgi:cytochrome c-type biogenesis protein
VQLLSVALIFLAGPSMTRWLNRDVRFHNLGGQAQGETKAGGALSGVTSGFLLGFAFAFGWTPCIGPILAAVLVLAANEQTISRGVFLLAIYSAGLAVPFLLTAIGINQFLRFYQRFKRHLHTVEVLSGVLLLFVGGLIFLNRLTWLSGKLGFLNKFAL